LSETFRVRIAKAEHVFCAAHFITIGGMCERLHGHNYHVVAEFAGTLDENRLVIDFLLVRARLREIVATLDHFVLLPTQHPHLHVVDDGREVIVSFGESRWIFPSGDCRLLPVANTTAELLSKYIGQKLLAELKSEAGKLQHIRIEVDECDGQIAIWEHSI
jgi:6-pyruvoyltetrahydropterin/6-carboxytetrahydropterin synthase